MKARNQLEGSRSVCYYGASYEHMKRLLKTICRAHCSARMIFFHDQLFSIWFLFFLLNYFQIVHIVEVSKKPQGDHVSEVLVKIYNLL